MIPNPGEPYFVTIKSDGKMILVYNPYGDRDIPLEKKSDGSFSTKFTDGSSISISRNPHDDSWITETKDTDGTLTTTNRNGDGSFTIITVKDG
jgi:hypothetical protein